MKARITECLLLLLAAFAASACATSPASRPGEPGGPTGGGGDDIGINPTGGGGSTIGLGGSFVTTGDGGVTEEPQTCDEAANSHSYVGCEFWPTITANPVYVEFDPAVVVANGSGQDATVTVDGPAAFHQQVTVKAGGLQTILLKWVPDLKGPEFSLTNTSGGRLTESSRVDKGAYKMTSTVPVTAWQFNPLQYVKPGSACPRIPGLTQCISASADASLLLPTTAMTGNYRVFTYSGSNEGMDWGHVPGGIAITATKDGTMVKVETSKNCGVEIFPTKDLGVCVAAGKGVEAKNGGQLYDLVMNAGDVVQLVGAWSMYPQTWNADLSGSIVNASAPVQVVSFNAIAQLPNASVGNADHMEETVLPGEVLGKKYIVVPPTTPMGNAVGHVVRIYGNVDGTNLTYPEGMPPGAPTVINAGEMVQLPHRISPSDQCSVVADHCMTSVPFIVEGDKPFAVLSFMVGATLQIPGSGASDGPPGDPAMSMMVTPEQFRQNYTFLAPSDFQENFADVLVPQGAAVTLDGKALSDAPTKIGNSEWGIVRAKLAGDNGGVHKISTTDARGLGLQVEGFGKATSFYYPGGLNLKRISEPPIVDIK
jgi:IgGFc binding protein